MRLPPALAPPRPPALAAHIVRPGVEQQESLSPLDAAMLHVFRWALRQQTCVPASATPGFRGMVEELRTYQRGASVAEQREVAFQTMAALGGPLPATFKLVASERSWAPASLAFCTSVLLHFLVGDLTLTQRKTGDARGGGVVVERCAVLEQTGCKGICVHMCKVPTEQFFAERWGVPLHMAPNFETGQCQLSFGEVPPAVDEDPTMPAGCLAGCPAAVLGSRGRL
jgi:beta-carotene isomerase